MLCESSRQLLQQTYDSTPTRWLTRRLSGKTPEDKAGYRSRSGPEAFAISGAKEINIVMKGLPYALSM
jgi:hypothetical protein